MRNLIHYQGAVYHAMLRGNRKHAIFHDEGERLGQGRENAKQFLRENPDLAEEIEDKLRVEMGLPTFKPVAETASAEDQES